MIKTAEIYDIHLYYTRYLFLTYILRVVSLMLISTVCYISLVLKLEMI